MVTYDPADKRASKVLNHPTRIRIIQELGRSGPLSWKELSVRLGIGTGSLYHHLDILERIVVQDDSKKYALTKVGNEVFAFLGENHVQNRAEAVSRLVQRKPLSSHALGVLVPRSAIHFMASNKLRAISLSFLFLALSIAIFANSRTQVLLLSLSLSQSLVQSVTISAASAVTLVLALYGGLRALHVKPNLTSLLVSASASTLPLSAFSLIYSKVTNLGVVFLSGPNALAIWFVVLQGWSAGIIGAGISVAGGLRIERALLGSMMILYLSVLLMLALGVRVV